MRMYYKENEDEQLNFAYEAARHFEAHPSHSTYTSGEIKKGAWFAMKYGLTDDCVVVFKIDDCVDVVNYCQFISKGKQP